MITGSLKNKINSIWQDFYNENMAQTAEIVNQLTTLMFIKMLDDKQNAIEAQAAVLGIEPQESELTFLKGDYKYKEFINGKEQIVFTIPYKELRWKNFKNLNGMDLADRIKNYVIPFIKDPNNKSVGKFGALLNVEKGTEERLNKLYVLQGSKPIEVPELHAGDIGAIAKLVSVQTGDSLAGKANPVLYPKAILSTPYTYKRFKAVNKGDEDKISQALSKIMSEDKTVRVENDGANRQSLIYGMGDQHLDVVVSMLKDRYKVDVELSKPKVPFRETIRKNSDVEGKHKKQSGGHGQYGHVKMRFEPSGDMETPYVFEQVVVGGAVPKNYFPAVEKGLQECVQKGPLAAYPVVGVKATLYDGSYHPVDSSEMAFKMATILAFKKGFMDASPVLLEPIVSMKVTVPDKYTGDVMGDLNKRRGRVLGMNPDHNGNTIIEADVPLLEIYGYSTDLRSMTGGSGDFSYEFARYEQAPGDIQQKEIEARASKVAADAE